MNTLRIMAALAGGLFGAYPLFLTRSGLSSNWQSAAFAGSVFILALPFAFRSGNESLLLADWRLVAISAVAATGGMLLLTRMLSEAKLEDYGELFAIMMIAQLILIAGVAAYARFAGGGGIPWDKAIWYVVICIGAFKLLR